MHRWRTRVLTVVAAATTVGGFGLTGVALAETTVQNYGGQLADGATWVADVPAPWNGTTILYSHGFGPLVAQDAPDAATKQELLDEGYALVGSSYSGSSWWALESALDDQFGALAALEQSIGPAKRTIAWGTSMGGLVSALEAEDPRGQVDGALTTCGLVGGALNIDDYQLYGEYALSHLLAPGQPIKLVDYQTPDEAGAAGAALSAVVTAAQDTPQGRARTALGAALMNQPTWAPAPAPGAAPPPEPGPRDYAGQEAQQAQGLSGLTLGFVMFGRYHIEQAAGGNSSGTVGVDFRALLASSSHLQQVRALYRQAGLDLDADLATLARDADIRPDPAAIESLARTSMVTGRLRVPELDIHTTADHLIPVEHENWYEKQVARAGAADLLRQAYVHANGHCAFSPAETIAAFHAVERRLDTGRWGATTLPPQLNRAAAAVQLGGEAPRYVWFCPPLLVGCLGEPGAPGLPGRHGWPASHGWDGDRVPAGR